MSWRFLKNLFARKPTKSECVVAGHRACVDFIENDVPFNWDNYPGIPYGSKRWEAFCIGWTVSFQELEYQGKVLEHTSRLWHRGLIK